jgi:ABC-type sugar transport system substrate-binding protein
MNNHAHRALRSRQRGWRLRLIAPLAVLGLVAAACGDSDDGDAQPAETTAPAETTVPADTGTDTTEPAESTETTAAPGETEPAGDLTETLLTAFQAEVPQDELDPLIVESLELASQDLTDEQLDVAFDCWTNLRCDIPGGGDVVVGIADGFGDNTWRKFSLMEAIMQALTYPEIGEIIYTNAGGDLTAMQANIRSLSAQGVDVMLTYNDFGPAVYPAYEAAQQEGAIVASYVSPSPDGEEAVDVTVTSDLCQVGREGTEAAAELAEPGSPIALFTGTPGNPQGQAWFACAEDTAAEVDLDIAYRADTNWTPAGAFEAATALIATGEEVDAIVYDYSTPLVQVTEAYLQAETVPPDYVAWTMDNGLFCQWEELQGGPNEFQLMFTHSLNWAARTALTAAMNKLAGGEVPSVVTYPMPFVAASEGLCQPDMPGDFPASALVPDTLISRMLG